jgi:hypothetical protein
VSIWVSRIGYGDAFDSAKLKALPPGNSIPTRPAGITLPKRSTSRSSCKSAVTAPRQPTTSRSNEILEGLATSRVREIDAGRLLVLVQRRCALWPKVGGGVEQHDAVVRNAETIGLELCAWMARLKRS